MKLNSSLSKTSHFPYLVLLLVIAIAGYWQIAFLKYGLPHDMVNCWLPWRYYISESLQQHTFPFWNPYQQMGYPIHADLQGPAWNLESILLSLTTGQGIYSLQFLFIFYVFLSGVGMYFFSLCFHSKKNVAFLVAVCYMLSGFFVGHVQHFYAIISAAFLPFILLNFYKMHVEKSYKRAIYTAIFLFFSLTGGNHTFTIILSYLLLLITVYFIVSSIKNKTKALTIKLIKLNVFFGFCALLLGTVVFVIVYQTAPYISRLGGINYADAATSPLSPQSLLSLLLPFSTVNGIEIFQTDASMSNVYFGIIMLLFGILAIFSKKTAFEKCLLGFAILCLLASFGNYTPVHWILFRFFPMMNVFRFPSYFSLFFILILLALAGKQIAQLELENNLSKIKRLAIIFGVTILGFVGLSITKNGGTPLFFLHKYTDIFEFIHAASFYQEIILQGTIQLIFIILFIIAISSKWKKHWLKITTVLIVFDMLIAVQLNLAYVGISNYSPKELHNYLSSLPHNFPKPDMNNISENTEERGQFHGLFRNTSVFHRRISADGYNTFTFKNQMLLMDSFPQLYRLMQKNPILYLSDEIHSIDKIKIIPDSSLTHHSLFIDAKEHAKLSSLFNSNLDSSIESIVLTNFKTNEFDATVKSNKNQLLTLLQCKYTGWKAFIDGKETPIIRSNFLTMSIFLPKGKHKIEFKYSNPTVIFAAFISYGTFVLLLVFLLQTVLNSSFNSVKH